MFVPYAAGNDRTVAWIVFGVARLRPPSGVRFKATGGAHEANIANAAVGHLLFLLTFLVLAALPAATQAQTLQTI